MNIQWDKIKKIYLMAICGTGMGSLAGLLKQKGYDVCGSDNNVYPPMSDELISQHIPLFSPFSADNIQAAKPDLVIVGNAISKTNPEVPYLLDSGIPYLSMPQALNHFFLSSKDVIVISGTHGKTTTTSIMAHLLQELGEDPSFMVGGVTRNFSKNFRIGSGKYFVIEGDEYDTAFFDKGPKFLHYNPKHVIMTSLEFDHADIYRDVDQIRESFTKLARIIPQPGSLHVNDGYPELAKVSSEANCAFIRNYGTNNHDWQIQNYQASATGCYFEIRTPKHAALKITAPMTGIYNAQNIAACLSVIEHLGLSLNKAITALASFKGVKRRQEVLFENKQHVVIDDFAHHPTAVAETIQAIRERFPARKLIAVFEPRSNTSRRNVFQKEYVQSFLKADVSLLAPVNQPDKVPNGAILDIPRIVTDIAAQGKLAFNPSTTEDIIKEILIQASDPSVILIMSNGGFDQLHQKLIQKLAVI